MRAHIKRQYEMIRHMYLDLGIDTDAVIAKIRTIPISIHCWQGDDVVGFLNQETYGAGGIQVTGNYPGRARNVAELRRDLEMVLSLIPGQHKINLHAIYADTKENVSWDKLEPKHFKTWVDWAKKQRVGLDFNPTLFQHPLSQSGFTLSHDHKDIRDFWIRHCKASRKIGAYFGKTLGIKSIVNIWIPDGYKDYPVDTLSPRLRLKSSLDEIFKENYDSKYLLDTLESKLFGIGFEAYTVGSHEFYLGYAATHKKAVCLDLGHFHPTESIADKLSSVLLYTDETLLHVSRAMRWDSDHVVTISDDLLRVTQDIIWNNLTDKVHIGLDFFDASINRVAAWTIGIRNVQKALLQAMLQPIDRLKKAELEGNYTERLYLMEMFKGYPFGIVYDYLCELEDIPTQVETLEKIRQYESQVKDR